MPPAKGAPKKYFPKIVEAREMLLEQAKEMIILQKRLILAAADAQEFEAALKANQWLIEHAPADENGVRIIDSSAAKPKELAAAPTGPAIQIGVILGGMTPKQLNPSVIDVTPLEDTENDKDRTDK